MSPTPRALARERTLAEITRIGREQLASVGAAALSLRSVARELGVVPSAIYQYISSRDDLLTLLIVDAYTELADMVDAELRHLADDDYTARIWTISRTVRAWAIRERARYALIFGSPVPGYAAPADLTIQPGQRVIRALMQTFHAAYRAGVLAPPTQLQPSSRLRESFAALRADFDLPDNDTVVALEMTFWSGVCGAINFEVFGYYGGSIDDPATLFDLHVEALLVAAGFQAHSPPPRLEQQ